MRIEYRPVPKPNEASRINKSQRQLGEIGTTADQRLKLRSGGICELCGKAWAVERAHLTGRKQIDHETEETDLIHLCKPCHTWIDETPEGIRARNLLAALIEYASLKFREIPGMSGG